MRKVTVLGATGSIGRQTMAVLAEHEKEFEVVGLGARGSNIDLLVEQAARFNVPNVAVLDQEAATSLRRRLPKSRILSGQSGLMDLAGMGDADIILCAIVGMQGLYTAMAAVQTGAQVALANKEALVAGGDLLLEAARQAGARLVPVDSEHSAIYQCLQGHTAPVRRIVLTASGGPFVDRPAAALASVTPCEALQHPNWSMGAKITIDSATLANKGLEVIEAHYLFEVPYDRIEVCVHRQSIVHSLVEFEDGSMLAHLGPTDMRIPIAYALSDPRRLSLNIDHLDLNALGQLTFEPPRWDDFPALGLAFAAGRAGGTMTAAYNAANEVAVASFLKGQLRFTAIPTVIESVMEQHVPSPLSSLEALTACDEWARHCAQEEAGRLGRK